MNFQNATPQQDLRILRAPQVLELTGECRSTLQNRIAAGLWTPPIPLGPRAVGWLAVEATAILAARVAGKTDDDIRGLVRQLTSDRAKLAA